MFLLRIDGMFPVGTDHMSPVPGPQQRAPMGSLKIFINAKGLLGGQRQTARTAGIVISKFVVLPNRPDEKLRGHSNFSYISELNPGLFTGTIYFPVTLS